MKKTHKIGENRGKRRIWLDGKALTDAGFTPGSVYSCERGEGFLRLCIPAKADLPLRKVSGRPTGKPIIDIIGRDVVAAFGASQAVSVEYRRGLIIITGE